MDWPPVLIICRIDYELIIGANPEIVMTRTEGVICFSNKFVPVIQFTVADYKSITTISKVGGVVS